MIQCGKLARVGSDAHVLSDRKNAGGCLPQVMTLSFHHSTPNKLLKSVKEPEWDVRIPPTGGIPSRRLLLVRATAVPDSN